VHEVDDLSGGQRRARPPALHRVPFLKEGAQCRAVAVVQNDARSNQTRRRGGAPRGRAVTGDALGSVEGATAIRGDGINGRPVGWAALAGANRNSSRARLRRLRIQRNPNRMATTLPIQPRM
jgi:hypothetical protein